MQIKIRERESVNRLVLEVNNFMLYFSYETLVAFTDGSIGRTFCSENVWGTTTGKFLNQIEPDHKKRLNNNLFNQIVEKLKIC